MSNATLRRSRGQGRDLAAQIERLDSMLDGLGEALNATVAEAVESAVGLAVKEAVALAVREVLSSPDLLRAVLALHEQRTPTPTTAQPEESAQPRPTPNRWTWLGSLAVGARRQLSFAWTWCLERLSWLGGRLAGCWTLACRFRRSSLLALGVGLGAGLLGYFGGPLLGALLCGLGGAGLTVAALILLPLWRLLGAAVAENA